MTHFVKLKAGTVLSYSHRDRQSTVTITEDMAKIRYSYEGLESSYKSDDYPQVSVGRCTYNVTNPDCIAEKIKLPSIGKDTRAQITKNSEWVFTKDWVFSGYDSFYWFDEKAVNKEYTIPAGTTIKIVKEKLKKSYFGLHELLSVECEYNPALDMFKDGKQILIPAQELFQYIELVSAQKTKTYWKLEESDGTAISTKRYSNMAAVKGAVRAKGGLVSDAADTYWLAQSNELDFDRGVFAVEYDYMTDKEMQKVDMAPYLTISVLTKA